MGYVKKEIKRLSTEAGSKARAKADAEDWFSEGKKNRAIREVIKTRERFLIGKIYSFDYTPITEDLPWYDMSPVVFALDSKNNNDLGVNLNLLPTKFKEEMLDKIHSALVFGASGDASREGPLRITYDGMKLFLERYGFGFAIRQYIPSRKRNQATVSYQSWPKIALCDFASLNGASYADIVRLHAQYIRK